MPYYHHYYFGKIVMLECQNRQLSDIVLIHYLGSVKSTENKQMRRYVIERSIPGVGNFNQNQLRGAAATSNQALAKLAGKVQWERSYVVEDKTFCVYLAENEDAVKEHAKLSGFPANKITEVQNIIDPLTANS